jgi:hypothetical protein
VLKLLFFCGIIPIDRTAYIVLLYKRQVNNFDLLCKGGYKMNRWKLGLPAAVVLCAVLLASCSDFFTTSWGKARDPGTITVTTKNVKSLLKESKGDPTASRGILEKIAEELEKNPNQPELQTAAITAANQASGLTGLVLDNIGDVLNANEDTFTTLLGDIQETAKENKLDEISVNVVNSLGPAVTTGKPQFIPGVAEKDKVSDAELAQLALTLILAESEKASQDIDAYIAAWGTGKSLDSASGLSESELILAAIAHELASRPGKLGSMISDLLKE